MHKSEFCTVTLVMDLVSSIGLHFYVNLNFSVFCDVFLKLRKFCTPCDNVGKKVNNFFLADPIIFHYVAGNQGSHLPVSFFITCQSNLCCYITACEYMYKIYCLH